MKSLWVVDFGIPIKVKRKIFRGLSWPQRACHPLREVRVGHPKAHICKRLKVHKNENFFGSDLEFCTISFLVTLKN
jgi:hypothetical protein